MAAKINLRTYEETNELIIGSVYLLYHQPGTPLTPEVQELVQFSNRKNTQLLLCCDSNAHHTSWGRSDTNRLVEPLLEFIISNKLEVVNRGNEPTVLTSTRRELST